METPSWSEATKIGRHGFYKAISEGVVERVQGFLDNEEFKGVDKYKLFQELLILKFWITDIVYFEDKDKNLINAILKAHFHDLDYSVQEEGKKLIGDRFNSYNNSWDHNAGGRQFIFASRVLNNIFGMPPKNFDLNLERVVSILILTLLTMKNFYIAKAEIRSGLLKIDHLPPKVGGQENGTNIQFFKKKPTNLLDELIFSVYGNPPPPKTAKVDEAIEIAYKELLIGIVSKEDVTKLATDLNAGPIPYSTHDLALSVALHFFKQPDLVPRLGDAQLIARFKALKWSQQGKVVPPLVQIFEDILYNLYKVRREYHP
ncbi:MAG: hypothetical protein AB1348_07750 [Nitrospirota bacterium]